MKVEVSLEVNLLCDPMRAEAFRAWVLTTLIFGCVVDCERHFLRVVTVAQALALERPRWLSKTLPAAHLLPTVKFIRKARQLHGAS